MKKVVDALVKVLEGAKIICENRGKKQVLGQDIIDHLLRTYPGSYRKVFHQRGRGRRRYDNDMKVMMTVATIIVHLHTN